MTQPLQEWAGCRFPGDDPDMVENFMDKWRKDLGTKAAREKERLIKCGMANMVAWQEMPEFTMEDMTEVWGTLSLNAFKSLDKFECLQLEPTTMQRARAHLPRIDKLLNSPSVPENYKRKLRGVKYFLENPESTDASGCSRLNQQLSELEDRVLKANAPEEDK